MTSALSAQLEIPKRSSGYQTDKKVLPCCRGSSEGAVAREEAPSHQRCPAAPTDPRGDEGGTCEGAVARGEAPSHHVDGRRPPNHLAMKAAPGTPCPMIQPQPVCWNDRQTTLTSGLPAGPKPSATSRPSLATPTQSSTSPLRITGRIDPDSSPQGSFWPTRVSPLCSSAQELASTHGFGLFLGVWTLAAPRRTPT